MQKEDTIYALSSGRLPSAIAIIRISGNQVKKIFKKIIGQTPKERNLELVKITSLDKKDVLDEGLVTFFSAKKSITGEDLGELHVHGSHAVIHDIFDTLGRFDGVRPAEPGEFTKRSLNNGKLDLTEVEALADLIDSETSAQRKQALKQMKGALSKKYNMWRGSLIKIRAELEAILDFSDELDVETYNTTSAQIEKIKTLILEIKKDIHRGAQGTLIRNGIKIALIGAPNVGKSSLINILLKEKRAIVSSEEGTTRDVIEARLNLRGVPVSIYDTAGIRRAEGKIEAEGIKKSKNVAKSSDIIVLVKDPKEIKTVIDEKLYRDKAFIEVYNKIDLYKNKNINGLSISCKTGKGVLNFIRALERLVESLLCGEGEDAVPNRVRHISNLRRAQTSLKKSLTELNNNNIEISAEFLRSASSSLGRIIGQIDVEEVLDSLFKDFCIGK